MNRENLTAAVSRAAVLTAEVSRLELQTPQLVKMVQTHRDALEAAKSAVKGQYTPVAVRKVMEAGRDAGTATEVSDEHLAELERARGELVSLEPALKRAEQLVWLEGLNTFAQTSLERAAEILEQIDTLTRPMIEELEALSLAWWPKHRELNFWHEHHKTFGVWNSEFVRLDGVLETLRSADRIVLPEPLKQSKTATVERAASLRSSLAAAAALNPFTVLEEAPLTAPDAPHRPAQAVPGRDITPYVNKVLGRTETPSSIPEHVRAAAARVGRTLP